MEEVGDVRSAKWTNTRVGCRSVITSVYIPHTHVHTTYTCTHKHIGIGTRGAGGAWPPPILGIMYIKYAEFILEFILDPPNPVYVPTLLKHVHTCTQTCTHILTTIHTHPCAHTYNGMSTSQVQCRVYCLHILLHTVPHTSGCAM